MEDREYTVKRSDLNNMKKKFGLTQKNGIICLRSIIKVVNLDELRDAV